ncbi:hypothetical protein LG634_16470 [Streptomyces bambusae]|uniref:hypothetical protein n=1 Tax=Streptomyces bambusae TaxID=1550616 RepID=UPI001CFD5418|nr:hypothetical protein [Streptomyces bambusae]MCB5166426.1 hypothetical protein [Streptomyces bambusae]
MHTPAVPDPAHTRTRPVHWIATAAALAAVVTAAGLLQPAAAGTPDAHGAPGAPVVETPVIDAAAVTYPLDCRGAGQDITARATGDLDGDGRPETVAAVRCAAGLGTPPNGVYVLTAGPAGPRVVATLLDPAERQNAIALTVRGGTVTATLLGYSTPDVPRCCPDTSATAKWRWSGGKFLRTTAETKRV